MCKNTLRGLLPLAKEFRSRDEECSCTQKLPKSSYAESCKPFTVHPHSYKEVVVSKCGSYWGSGSDFPGVSLCLGSWAGLDLFMSLSPVISY